MVGVMVSSFDMRFLVQDYLRGLTERDELDAILPDLLRAMGMRIVKLAFRGEVEHGIDIAAVKQDGDEATLYLIQVKAGNINPSLWDSGPNAVRQTLNNILDVRFEDLTDPKLQAAKRYTLLVHNGYLRENIRDRFNGYIEHEFQPRMPFERWNLDTLAELFHQHLLSERLLPRRHQGLLKRTLVFLDVPDYDLVDFDQFLRNVLPDVQRLRKPRRIAVFGLIRLVLAMIRRQSQAPEFDDLNPAIIAYERALLLIWGWMFRHSLFSQPVMVEYLRVYSQYLDLLLAWADRIAPAVNCADGLMMGAPWDRVEYPMRTFSVIGNLGLLVTAVAACPSSDWKQEQLPMALDLLVNAIVNNPARHRPLLDNHSVDILLGMMCLTAGGNHDLARWWLRDILEHMAIRKRFHQRLPELSNRIDAVIEFEASGERPTGYTDSSSSLIYMLFELCVVLDAEDTYLTYRDLFPDTSYQIWYPPADVEEELYVNEVFRGDTEIIYELPADFDDFRLDVQARHQFDRMDYSPIQHGVPVILLLASKHYRTPLFPFWWRESAFAAMDE